MSRPTVHDLRKGATRAALDVVNLIRRMFPAETAGGEWAVQGYEIEDEDTGETFIEGDGDDPVEVFGGVGIYARPAAGSEAEVILAHVGANPDHPAIIALRDEDARKAYVAEHGDIEPGETAIFASDGKTRLILKPGGDVIIEVDPGNKILARSKGGTASALVTTAAFLGHGHATAAVGPVSGPIAAPPTSPAPFTFTTVFEGE